jgi:tetratricopeptide (TPR) repeat protein
MRNLAAAAALLLSVAFAPSTLALDSADAALRPDREMEAGYRLLYEQKFAEARERFSAWGAAHPGDPFGDASLAAACLFEEFFHQGVMSSDYFLDDRKFLRGIEGSPDPGRMDAFRKALGRAREAAGLLLKKDPRDPEALFVMTLAAGMESNALSILEKQNLDGLRLLKESNNYAERLLEVRPEAADAWLALGSANYVIGCLSGAVRFFLWFGGYHGDRELGMAQLEKTARHGTYLQPYAKILLALAARREGRDDLARGLLEELTRDYPASPLFAAEFAKLKERPASRPSR